jgi:molybdopterin converting factor subunit 1
MNESTFFIDVLLFATLRERIGERKIQIEIPRGSSIWDLKQQIAELYPSIAESLRVAIVSVNHEFAQETDLVPEHAEIAIFPPVSGGSDPFPSVFSITENMLDLDDLVTKISTSSTGASCIFMGMVRGITTRNEAHETSYLEYEAYIPMAEAKMEQVAGEIRERWPSVEGIAIVQRIGRLFPQTPTIIIACTAAHRDTGVFEAARYGIDRLKEIVPIWKREVGPNGQEWVEGSYIPNQSD